jgi:flagellin
MPLACTDKWICLMNIREQGWTVGSLSASDPNGQSFRSPDRRHSDARNQPHHEGSDEDFATLDTQSAYRNQSNPVPAKLGSAISLNQTQDGFLKMVQEALQRMSKLSTLAQGCAKSGGEQQTYTDEFAHLQNQLKDFGAKMSQALSLFKPPGVTMALESEDPGLATVVDSVVPSDSVEHYIENTANPSRTAIDNATNASLAVTSIDRALEVVTDLRVKVGTNIQRLNLTREQLSARNELPGGATNGIGDSNVAQEKTSFARYEILTRSGTAMLAQANAFPASALRLLD